MKWIVTAFGGIISGIYALSFQIEPKKIVGIFTSTDFEKVTIVIGYWGLGLLLGLIISEVSAQG
jgi:hypothetical protein